MSTPYGPPGAEEPPQWGQQPSTQGYPGTPAGGVPAQGTGTGYPQGYPQQGHPAQQGPPQQGHPPGYPQGYSPQGYPTQAYPPQGYPAQDYPVQGYPPGYPVQGYPQQGYPPPAPPGPGYHPGFGHPPGYDQYGQPLYPQPAGYQSYGQEQEQQPYPASPGQPGQPGQDGPAPKSGLPWLIVGVGGIVLAVIIILGFVTPGLFTTTIFDQNAVQEGVRRILSEEYGQQAQSVACPADQEVRSGATFTCQAMIDGQQRNVTITVKTDAGEYEVARPS